jgi:hypothetical protein
MFANTNMSFLFFAEEDEETVVMEVVNALCDELLIDALCALTC